MEKCKEKKLTPEIRFKGFTNAWEQRRLGEIVSLFGGNAFSSNDATNEGALWLKIANVGIGCLQWDIKSYLPTNFLVDYSTFTLNKGDYVMALTRPILNREMKIAQITSNDILLNQRVAKLDFSEEADFGFQLLRRKEIIDKIDSELSGTDPPNLSSSTLDNIDTFIPNEKEQIAIGSLFQTLDDTITLHKRKLDGLKKLKKAYLQQMFPQTGEHVPRLRFTGFTEDWMERTINSIAGSTHGGGTPSTINGTYWNGDIPWLQSSDITEHNIIDLNLRKHITNDGLNNSATKLIPANSIAIVTRVGVGKLSVVPFDFTTSQDFLSLSNLDVATWFGAYALYTKLQKEAYSVQGTSIKGITKDELLNRIISVPRLEKEQISIGNFFYMFDKQIATQESKLNQLKKLKVAYLQKMFV